MDFLQSILTLAAILGGIAAAIWLGIHYGSKWIDRVLGIPRLDPRRPISIPLRMPEKELAHAIYKAWMADERWLRIDLATIARGNPVAFFWAEIAARAAIINSTSMGEKP